MALQDSNINHDCANQHQGKTGPGYPRCSQPAAQQDCRCKIEYRYFEKYDPHHKDIETMCREHKIKPLCGKQMDCFPAGQCHHQAKKPPARKKDYCNYNIYLDQIFILFIKK